MPMLTSAANRAAKLVSRGGLLMIMSKFDSAFHSFKSPKTANDSDRRLRRARVKWRGAGLLSIALIAAAMHSAPAYAGENDAVSVWNERAIITLTNGTGHATTPGVMFPPPVAFIHLGIVQGAVYDAVNAIKGGHDPYLRGLKAPTSASKGAAAATAAHHVLIGLVNQAPVTATLTAGINVGAAAAAAMLANRVGDGRFGAANFPFPDPAGPGQWRPSPGNDPNAWVRSVRPFTLPVSEFFHTPAPLALTSTQYATEFNEVKAVGGDAATGSTRDADQTALALWSTAHPAIALYAAMRQVAAAKGLTISEQARFHAMTSMSGADSLINCWAEKAHHGFWRPTTAIRLAADDGNAATDANATWTPLGTVPPYADEPSGANCVYSGVMNSARAFFGSNSAQFDIGARSYTSFSSVIADVIEARILLGIHFRSADVNGAWLGQSVAG